MKIDNPTGDSDCHKPSFEVRFESRRVEDLRADYPREAFMRVRQASEFNEGLYLTFISPWVQAYATPFSAEMLKWLQPMRMSRYLFLEQFNQSMRNGHASAATIAVTRSPLP